MIQRTTYFGFLGLATVGAGVGIARAAAARRALLQPAGARRTRATLPASAPSSTAGALARELAADRRPLGGARLDGDLAAVAADVADETPLLGDHDVVDQRGALGEEQRAALRVVDRDRLLAGRRAADLDPLDGDALGALVERELEFVLTRLEQPGRRRRGHRLPAGGELQGRRVLAVHHHGEAARRRRSEPHVDGAGGGLLLGERQPDLHVLRGDAHRFAVALLLDLPHRLGRVGLVEAHVLGEARPAGEGDDAAAALDVREEAVVGEREHGMLRPAVRSARPVPGDRRGAPSVTAGRTPLWSRRQRRGEGRGVAWAEEP
jgi:hypothetical protein